MYLYIDLRRFLFECEGRGVFEQKLEEGVCEEHSPECSGSYLSLECVDFSQRSLYRNAKGRRVMTDTFYAPVWTGRDRGVMPTSKTERSE